MKATDLMIGDWVLSFGEPHKIIGIRTDTPYPYIKTNMSDTWYEWGMKDLADGIPITPEILEKNGFVVGYKQVDYEQVDYEQRHITYYHIGLDFYLDLYGGEILLKIRRDFDFTFLGIISCNYIHELQHALRLCGIEKEIVL